MIAGVLLFAFGLDSTLIMASVQVPVKVPNYSVSTVRDRDSGRSLKRNWWY